MVSIYEYIQLHAFRYHACSRVGRKEHSVKNLRFPISVEFLRQCMLSYGIQRLAIDLAPVRSNENINNSFPRVGIETSSLALPSNTCATTVSHSYTASSTNIFKSILILVRFNYANLAIWVRYFNVV